MAWPRVLLADDYPRLIAAINRLLGEHACEVVGTATDGVQLLEEAVRLQPDVVLLDLFMPKLNGLDACPELGRVLPRPKIIVLTADADPDLRRAALTAARLRSSTSWRLPLTCCRRSRRHGAVTTPEPAFR